MALTGCGRLVLAWLLVWRFGCSIWVSRRVRQVTFRHSMARFLLLAYLFLLIYYCKKNWRSTDARVQLFLALLVCFCLWRSKNTRGFILVFVGRHFRYFIRFSHVAAKNYILFIRFGPRLFGLAPQLAWSDFCLLFPSVWQALRHHTEAKSSRRKHAGSIIVLDKVLSVVAVILIQYAYATGVVTVVSAIGGLQYVFMFVMVYLLTKFLPRIFKEYFTKRVNG